MQHIRIDAFERVAAATRELRSRAAELGRQFTTLTRKADLDAQFAAHPWRAVGLALALGMLASPRRVTPAGWRGALGLDLGALALRAAKAYAFSELLKCTDLARSSDSPPAA